MFVSFSVAISTAYWKRFICDSKRALENRFQGLKSGLYTLLRLRFCKLMWCRKCCYFPSTSGSSALVVQQCKILPISHYYSLHVFYRKRLFVVKYENNYFHFFYVYANAQQDALLYFENGKQERGASLHRFPIKSRNAQLFNVSAFHVSPFLSFAAQTLPPIATNKKKNP